MRIFERYVALGDSTTEGLDDPDDAGGYRGWANRFAERVAAAQGSLLYANLGVRGRCAADIERTQLSAAIAMRPDLATVVAGMNDLLRWDFDAAAVAGHIGAMQRALIDRGATVLTFTIPDVSSRMRLPRAMSERTTALNDEIRRVSADSGALLLDLAIHGLAHDPRLWAPDRLHANAEGHARIGKALAYTLGVPDTDDDWLRPLPEAPARPRGSDLREDLDWLTRYVLPWAWRRVRGISAGDSVTAKRPALAPMT